MAPFHNVNGKRKIAILNHIISQRRRRRQLQQNIIALMTERRNQIIKTCLMALAVVTNMRNNIAQIQMQAQDRLPRSCRRHIRNHGWWENVWNNYSDARFKETFRLSKNTFLYILDRIRNDIEKDFMTEEPISPECRLAICLYRLGRGDYLFTISELTGYGVATCCKIVIEVSNAILKNLWTDSVASHFPTSEEEFKKCMVEMESEWQFPCCFGAIDGCHIPIKCPSSGLEACKEFHNFKNFYSIVLMGIIDAHYRFIWASAGFPGNSHDSIIFQSTQLYEDITVHNCIPPIAKNEAGTNIYPLILGDSAFAFKPWVMKPYTNAVLTPQQRNFNYRLSRARMVTEGAYGKLKGRWRVLYKKCESRPENVKIITLACVILHNVCIDKGDTVPRHWDFTKDPASNKRRPKEEV